MPTMVAIVQQRKQPAKSPVAFLHGLPLKVLIPLSANLIFFALILPLLKDTPLVFLFKYSSLTQHHHDAGLLDRGRDALSLIRSYKVLPPLTSLRMTDGTFDLARRSKDGPILVIWCISMPMQHVKRWRTKAPVVHRVSGYVTLVLSFILSVSGLVLPRKGLNFRHPDYWYIHTLRYREVPLIGWPNFSLQTDILGVVVLFTAYKTLVYARKRDYVTHRFWAQLHTYTSYAVPIQRIWMYMGFGVGLVLPLLPSKVLADLDYPLTDADTHGAELGAFANSVFMTWLTILFLVYRDWRTPKTKQT
ncbi:uncharacterized protein SRS1_21015 [Sporisorium reilianum f. sp. reilianum]|uniref:Uncharacterized protein n=1 Tax=Sporisorium reilianum f. sp. reilianum TaxID=72559 RepID=A0A2N8U9Q8_9BASI|nr:uncharacterized protein SRS1_21015 [Sporisorium reilianum f. sp. reilianum]